MSYINTDDQSLVPILMGCILGQTLPGSLAHLKDSKFITKLLVICNEGMVTDPLTWAGFKPSPANHPCGPIPTTGCFVLTLIGKWDDIKTCNYSRLLYKVSHIHNNDKNDQATIDALQEMGRHINGCFTHPTAKQIINQANGRLSSLTNTIAFGLVINVDNNGSGKVTYIDPSDPSTQHTVHNADTSYLNTPPIGWLCLFFMCKLFSHEFCYHFPIVDLSLHARFMNTYNPNNLPPAEALAYRALIDKWNNEKCKKELSCCVPKPNQLNPYTYLEAWDDSIELFLAVQKKEQEEEAKQQQAQEYFDEYKRLSLQQQTLHITSHIEQQQQQGMEDNDDIRNIDPSLITTLSSTLHNEYYAEYLYNQLNDLKIINHLQSHQYQRLSDAKLRYPLHHGYIHRTPRKNIVLPSSTISSTSPSQIDTLIELATTPAPATTSTPASLSIDNDNIINQQYNQKQIQQQNLNITNQQYNQKQIQQQNLAILHHQYNLLDEKKHILTIECDELSALLQSTIDNKDNEIQTLKQQKSQLQKEMITLQEQIKILQQKITTSNDELITTKEEYENEITILKEECHRKELNAVKEAMGSALTNPGKDVSTVPPHINNQISFLQQQLQSKDEQIKDIIQSKDQQIALLTQMLAEANKK